MLLWLMFKFWTKKRDETKHIQQRTVHNHKKEVQNVLRPHVYW